MFEKYKVWMQARNTKIISNLPKEVDYEHFLKHSPFIATSKYNIIPVRSFDTFLKIRGNFSIHQYKGD